MSHTSCFENALRPSTLNQTELLHAIISSCILQGLTNNIHKIYCKFYQKQHKAYGHNGNNNT